MIGNYKLSNLLVILHVVLLHIINRSTTVLASFPQSRGSTHLEQMLAGLQGVHEVLRVDVDVGVEELQPLRQVLLHGVEVLVSSGETPQLSLLHQLERESVLLTAITRDVKI